MNRRSKTSRPSAVPTEGPTPIVVDSAAANNPPPLSLPDAPEGRRIVLWPIERLESHPEQAALFHDLDGPEFEGMVESMARKGLREPVCVTPDGMIIDGHQRVRAARRLGWSVIRAWVRDDLAGDQVAIDREHIEANLRRRQLDMLDQVRLALRLEELGRGQKPGSLRPAEKDELRDRIGVLIGRCGRHAQRLMKILETPMAVQRAFSRGQLPLVQAERVSRLKRRVQESIAKQIEEGGDPGEIVAPHLLVKERPVRAAKTHRELMSAMKLGLELEGRLDEITHPALGAVEDLEILERFARFSPVLASHIARRIEESKRSWDELATLHGLENPLDEDREEAA